MIIAIEGIDQAGKHTQTQMLHRALKRQRKLSSKAIHFPIYDTPIGETIRQYLTTADSRRKPSRLPLQVLHCLQAANKWERLHYIQNYCRLYDVVIIDRYLASNVVYGMANGLERKWLAGLENGLPKADLTILLDISVDESFARRPASRDKFEKNKKFLNTVRAQYHKQAKKSDWKIIDAGRPQKDVHKDVLAHVLSKESGVSLSAAAARAPVSNDQQHSQKKERN